MKNLKNQMLELVKENLPEATAGEMKKYIESAEATKKELTKAEKKISILENAIKEAEKVAKLEREIKESLEEVIKETAEKIADVEEREKILIKGESELENKLLRIELDCAYNSSNQIMSLVEKVFGHPSVTVTNTKTTPNPPTKDQYGYEQYQIDTIETEIKTTRSEKE